ncbi:MAG: hypothetical protein BWY74_00918 [Firmicutes bacterium ADurb.Bin419]|nr:MAG: hypothetical protein BWY74_00918 [Firmicutes bacterium ADurb.Bin419]
MKVIFCADKMVLPIVKLNDSLEAVDTFSNFIKPVIYQKLIYEEIIDGVNRL